MPQLTETWRAAHIHTLRKGGDAQEVGSAVEDDPGDHGSAHMPELQAQSPAADQ